MIRIPWPNADTLLYFRTIATGSQINKGRPSKDRRSTELGGMLCVKIEAPGLTNNFLCLAIRQYVTMQILLKTGGYSHTLLQQLLGVQRSYLT